MRSAQLGRNLFCGAILKNEMKLLAWLTETFIQTFGITRPRPEQQRTAQLVIGGFLLAVILAVAGIILLLLIEIHAGPSR